MIPDIPYQRFQMAGGDVNAGIVNTFERINYDSTPIDAAVIGSSRTMLGISVTRLEDYFQAHGRTIHAANLSVFGDGRNLQWVIADELFRHHKPKVLILALYDNPPEVGHPTFRFAAPSEAVLDAALERVNTSPADLIYLPFRQLRLIAAQAFPAAFGTRREFDWSEYRRQPRDHTFTFRASSGLLIDMQSTKTPSMLRDGRKKEEAGQQRPMSRWARIIARNDETVYTDKIAALAASHGCRVYFVFIPHYEGSGVIPRPSYYARLGRVLTYSDLRSDFSKFSSWNHLNRAGALIVTDRLASVLASDLKL